MSTQYGLGYAILALVGLLVLSGTFALVHGRKRFQFVLSNAILIAIALMSFYLFYVSTSFTVGYAFLVYPFSMFFVFLFAVSLVLVNMLSYGHSSDFLAFSMLLGFTAAGMFAVAMAGSLVAIILGIELVSLPTAFMIMMSGKGYIESAVKLFVLAAISVAMLAFALALIFPYDPSLALVPYSNNSGVGGNYLVVLSLFLFIAGLAFDASIFPFNLWVPDVYQGAQANITALLAGVNKKVAFAALFEVLFILFVPLTAATSSIFQILAILTMFFGNLAALAQDNVKRLFAYSAISQAGYIAIGIAAATQYGIEASLLQIFAHTFMIIGTFAIVLVLESKNIKTIKDYGGLGERNGLAAFALTIFMLSMIGVPPLLGFVGKFLLFTSAIDNGLIFLTFVAIVNSLISVYYYARLIASMYSKHGRAPLVLDWTVSSVVGVCVIITIILGLYPQPTISIAAIASSSLYAI